MANRFLGDRLNLARVFQGMSLQDLGDAVSASRQYIQQIETGAKVPTHEMVLALALALNVEEEFFYVFELTMPEEYCHFRARKTIAQSMRVQAVAHGNVFNKLVEYLDDELDLPPVKFPHVNDINDPEDIERAAEKCRVEWGLGTRAPITNMARVLENAGALVTYFTDISEKIDAFSMHRRRPLVIRNPAKQSACRMRFDLAHECGHLVMHVGIETGDSKTETEANRFASAFLLPRAAFLNEFAFLGRSKRIQWQAIYELKLRWKTSIAAIIRRAYDLDLLDAIQYRNANIHLRNSGQSKKEMHDDDIVQEQPEVLKHAFEVLRDDGHEGLQPVLRQLNVRPDFMSKLVGDVQFAPDDFKSKLLPENVVRLPKR